MVVVEWWFCVGLVWSRVFRGFRYKKYLCWSVEKGNDCSRKVESVELLIAHLVLMDSGGGRTISTENYM